MSDIPTLQKQHASLDRLAIKVSRLIQEGKQDELMKTWTELEAGVRRHLAAEEMSIIPDYARADAQSAEIAQELEKEHDDLRRRFRDCRAALAQGEMPKDQALAALNAYRAHQVHEDTTLYRWASKR